MVLSKCAHLAEQAQVVVAGQTIRSEADIESQVAQFFILERGMLEILVTSWAVNEMETIS